MNSGITRRQALLGILGLGEEPSQARWLRLQPLTSTPHTPWPRPTPCPCSTTTPSALAAGPGSTLPFPLAACFSQGEAAA